MECTPHCEIDDQVENDYDAAKEQLEFACEFRRVDHREQVALDEAARISSRTARPTKRVLKGRKGTKPPEDFYGCSPTRRGKMGPWHPTPPEGEQTAEEREEDEREMGQSDEVS